MAGLADILHGSHQAFQGQLILPKAQIMVSVKLYASGTSVADNVANFIAPISGRLVLVSGTVRVTGSSTPCVIWQLSLQSTSQFATNDVRNVLAEIEQSSDGTNYGTSVVALPIPGLPITAGEKVYLHRSATGTVGNSTANLNVWIV